MPFQSPFPVIPSLLPLSFRAKRRNLMAAELIGRGGMLQGEGLRSALRGNAPLRTLPTSTAPLLRKNLYPSGPSLFPWPRGATPSPYNIPPRPSLRRWKTKRRAGALPEPSGRKMTTLAGTYLYSDCIGSRRASTV